MIGRRVAAGAGAIALSAGITAATIGFGATGALAVYPGGSSSVGFSHGTYHEGSTVSFRSGHHFKSHELVKAILVGPTDKHFNEGTTKAGAKGKVTASFKLGKKYHVGTYELVLKGTKSHARSEGVFNLK